MPTLTATLKSYSTGSILSLPQVLGPYQLIARLAVGGQAEVWFALRTGPGGFKRKCAIKILRPPNSLDPSARKSFMAEARLMANFDHPNLISVTDLGEVPELEILYSVMPYISGLTLASAINSHEPSATHATWAMIKVLQALDYAHKLRDERGRSLNICHRDISPENILFGFDGRVKLIDFGIALSTFNPRNTRMHMIKGKLDYLSPEQANGGHVDQRSDIYSAGILYYTLLAKINPLSGDPLGALERARTPKFRPVSDFLVLPNEIVALLQNMINVDRNRRSSDAGKIARELLHILHRTNPSYDDLTFLDWIRVEFEKEIQAETNFLSVGNKGTQIIKSDAPE